MGENFVNYHIYSDSISDAIETVKHITQDRAYVSPPKNNHPKTSDRNPMPNQITIEE